MTADAPNEAAKDGLDERIQQEFVDEARDVLNELDVMIGNVRSHAVTEADALGQIRRHCHNLLAGSRAVNLPAVEMVVHRLEDYVTDLNELPGPQLDDVQTFLDKLRAALAGEVAVGEISHVVRQLPARKTFDTGDIELLDIEVMLINPQRTAARFVERELQACGYRVINARSSFEAIALAVRGQPDMIICSAVLDELTGIDLACAFSAMPTTDEIPFALLTSFGWGHPSLARLPNRVAILRVGTHFGDDLAEALSRFKIT